MPHIEWRSPAAYEDLRSLDAPGFAWEFLIRNPAFERDCKRLEHADDQEPLSAGELDDFARRWGVRFRERCRHDRSQFGPVDSECPPECACPCRAAR